MTRRQVGAISLVAGALLIVATIAAYRLIANPTPPAVRATAPSLVTNQPGAASAVAAHNTPSAAVDPDDPRRVVLAERVDRPRFGCGVHLSPDAGLSWTDSVVMLPPGQDTCYIPDVAASVQVVVGLFLAPPGRWRRGDLTGRPALFTIVAYLTAGAATIGYLTALASGPASVVVPLVATSPALAAVMAILVLREPASKRRLAGIGLALAGGVLLASGA